MSSTSSSEIQLSIERELSHLKDSRVLAHIRGLLVRPLAIERKWDYGTKGQTFPCWTVLRHENSDTAIAFCDLGFGPGSPWGLISESVSLSMGMDSAWFPTFLGAYFDSFAATELPIWRVFKQEGDNYPGLPVTEEADWKSTWGVIEQLRSGDSVGRYSCGHSIKSVGDEPSRTPP
jgi:hypothetical protein